MDYKCPERQPISGCLSFLKENIFVLLGIMIVVFLCMHGLFSIYGFSAFPDEFGYWAPAAAFLGYDWSNVTSLGSYYSYGYSLVLFPILFFFRNSVIAYRFAIVVNMLLQCISIPMMHKILTFLFPSIKKEGRQIVAAISVLYPAWVYYTQMTMVEGLLNFLFVLTIFLMVRFLEKRTIARALLVFITSLFMYVVHMRCIGTIIATVIFMAFLLLGNSKEVTGTKDSSKKKTAYFIVPLILLVLFAGTFLFKDFIIEKIYGKVPDSVLSWNDYSGIMYRLSKVFSMEGFMRIFKEMCGKLYYIGCATYGLGYWGIVGLFGVAYNTVRHLREKKNDNSQMTGLFIFLACFMQYLVALVYLIGASDSTNNRLDLFLHGRYIDFFLPIVIAFGIMELSTCNKLWIKAIVIIGFHVLFMLVSYFVILGNETHMASGHGFTMVGMSYLHERGADTIPYFYKESALSIGLLIFVLLIVILYRYQKKNLWLFLIVLPQIILSLNVCDHYVFYNQDNIYGDVLMGQMLEDVIRDNPGKELLHVYEDGAQYIEIVQFIDRAREINVIDGTIEEVSSDRYLNDNTILIVDMDGPISSLANNYYKNNITVGHLSLFY